MSSLRRIARVAAAAACLSLASTAARAQLADRYTPRIANRASQQQLDRALDEFGFDPARLRPEQQRAIQTAWRSLLPDADPGRYVLNPAQATAIVYLALVHGRERRGGYDGYGRGGYGDTGGGYGNGRGGNGDARGGYGDARGDGRGGNDGDARGDGSGAGSACVALNQRVYDVQNAVNDDARSLFLDDQHKGEVRAAAREVQRMAAERGWRTVADRATDVIASVGETLPARSDVLSRVRALQRATDETCGADVRR